MLVEWGKIVQICTKQGYWTTQLTELREVYQYLVLLWFEAIADSTYCILYKVPGITMCQSVYLKWNLAFNLDNDETL